MSHQIRRVATVMLVLFGALFVNLNLIQLVRGEELVNNPANRRLIVREYQIERGPIVVGDTNIAYSVATEDDLKYLRVYEEPHLYSHLTGYYSFVLSRSGLESAMNEHLNGTPTDVLAENLAELLIGRDSTGNTVRLTIDPKVQAAARDALGDRVGSIVALDPRTGAVLASYSNPTFDPNPLSSHRASEIIESWDALSRDPAQPLLDRATRDLFAPGSIFKVVVAATALERGLQPSTALENAAEYTAPQTSVPIRNFSPGACGGGGATISLLESFTVSCNTVFARLGNDLGGDSIRETAERLGFNREIPYELPVVASRFPGDLDPPAEAQSAIGQRDVRITPMHAAMLVAAIVNDGALIRPHVVADVQDPAGRLLRGPEEGQWRGAGIDAQAISPRTAQQLREMMVEVVRSGTGRGAAIPDAPVPIGGKTGTADNPNAESATAWFIGFAGDQVAVAVVVPNAGGETGGRAAAPIARAVMEAALS
jgi:penicillin-binding protein A